MQNTTTTDWVKAISRAMVEKGIRTQKELSKISGVGENALSKILSGKTHISMESIEKISISLGYLVSELSAFGE